MLQFAQALTSPNRNFRVSSIIRGIRIFIHHPIEYPSAFDQFTIYCFDYRNTKMLFLHEIYGKFLRADVDADLARDSNASL